MVINLYGVFMCMETFVSSLTHTSKQNLNQILTYKCPFQLCHYINLCAWLLVYSSNILALRHWPIWKLMLVIGKIAMNIWTSHLYLGHSPELMRKDDCLKVLKEMHFEYFKAFKPGVHYWLRSRHWQVTSLGALTIFIFPLLVETVLKIIV